MKKTFIFCLLFAVNFCFAQSQGYQVGDKVKDFSLENLDGKRVSMANYPKAKGFIVIFTCNTCPIVKAYEDRIIALDAKYAKMGYPVIGINPNDPVTVPDERLEKMQEVAKAKGYTFPYLRDPNHVVTRQFGATRTPHVFLVQKQAKDLVLTYIGAIDNDTENTNPQKINYLSNAIAELEAGKAISLANTKAVGCTIKWQKAK